MKHFEKTKDGVTDALLRAYVSRPGNSSQICTEFDPDLASAYIELRLPAGSRSRYEHHLSECGACRKNVVALVRMADTTASVTPARVQDRGTLLSGLRRVFGAMSLPQWAMATTAALVLAISIPVLLTRESSRANRVVPASAVAEEPSGEKAQDSSQTSNQPQTGALDSIARSPQADSSTAAAQLKKREAEIEPKDASVGGRSAGASSVVGGIAELAQKPDGKSASAAADEAQRKPQSEVAAQPPAQAGAGSSQVAKKVDSEDNREQRQEKDLAKQAPESKPGRADEPTDKEKNAKAEEVAPPPAPVASPEASKSRGGLRRSAPKLALRDSGSAAESVRANEKRISNKDFIFKDNTWTDKNFDPGKNLPVVTIIRDSNVYKEVLSKRSGLRPYLDGFSENERAIIVFKGTVYKLIPQQ